MIEQLEAKLDVMTKHRLCAAVALLCTYQQIAMAESDKKVEHALPHHLSAFIGGSRIDSADETAFTLGVDYEYRMNELLGVGVVVEQAFGDVDSTTLLALADIHIWEGFVAQIGPGVEFIDDLEYAVGRFGALYEFKLDNHFTLSPQVHYDLSEGEDAIVFGFAVGRAF